MGISDKLYRTMMPAINDAYLGTSVVHYAGGYANQVTKTLPTGVTRTVLLAMDAELGTNELPGDGAITRDTTGDRERRSGHIVNISSIGVLTHPPRFSAYVASKAALDAFSACAASEYSDRNVHFTTIYMPLVKTAMTAPTKIYNAFPMLTPDEAAAMVMEAIIERPTRIATGLGLAGAVSHALTPKVSEYILNQAYHLFPDSARARGLTDEEAAREAEALPKGKLELARKLFVQVFQGVHW